MVAGMAFAVLVGFYLLCAGSLSVDECVAAAASAACGAALLVLIRRGPARRLALAAPWHRVLGAPVLQLVPDAVRVGGVLLRATAGRPAEGAVSWQVFRHGGDDARDAGRRALVTLAVSLAPNGFVLEAPGEADALLLHRLVPQPPRPDAVWPL